jgi:hypothetical protein
VKPAGVNCSITVHDASALTTARKMHDINTSCYTTHTLPKTSGECILKVSHLSFQKPRSVKGQCNTCFRYENTNRLISGVIKIL